MGLYAVINGVVVDGIAIADAPFETSGKWVCVDDVAPQPGPGWIYEDGVFLPPMLPVDNRPPIITKSAFRFRMTDAEYIGILQAAKTDVEVQAWVETFNMVSQIDLDNQRTKEGIENLVSKNLLTQERSTEILTAPVQSDERP